MRRATGVVCLVGLCLALVPSARADSRWIGFDHDGDETRIETVASIPGGVELLVELPGIELAGTATEAGDFVRARIPGVGRIGRAGEPELPALRRFVEIPAGARAEVSVEVLESATVNLAAEGLAGPLLPAQLPRPKCDGEEARRWRFSY